MAIDRTQRQSTEDQRLAQQLSLQRSKPPTDVPGYDAQSFIGSGAYGEVWRGVDRTTGRDVAIKFYTHRGGLDWSLLSREVEKLRFLSADRYVVQLLDVGWDADPAYYVMEYVGHGSLDDLLKERGSLSVDSAVEIFRELAVGLVHAHGKGVLHCDLKPANVLLDQDRKPRLADFGQSRLSDEQLPSLGTLFYMAPEQADLEAVPDARWDVYALGAILYCMLAGVPPFRHERTVQQLDSAVDLNERLTRYRQTIYSAPVPSAHRSCPGIDRALVNIIDRCLARDAKDRYPNVQSLIHDLRTRSVSRMRRPLLMLGFVGPILLLILMTLFAWRGFDRAMRGYADTVIAETLERNRWTAKSVAANVSNAIDNYYREVRDVAEDPYFVELVENVLKDATLSRTLNQLSSPELANNQPYPLRDTFVEHPQRQSIQQYLDDLIARQAAASWFVTNTQGTHIAAAFDSPVPVGKNPVGKNYAYRTYFHGGDEDLEDHVLRPPSIEKTHLSAAFESTATNAWKVAVSTPVHKNGKMIALVAMTLEMGRLTTFEGSNRETQFAVLVDGRPGKNQGVILEHPLYAELLSQPDRTILPAKLVHHRVRMADWDSHKMQNYVDPIGDHPDGTAYRKDTWLAARVPVEQNRPEWKGNAAVSRGKTGLFVLVQEDKAVTIKHIHDLGFDLVRLGILAFGLFLFVVGGLWFFVVRGFRQVITRGIEHENEPSFPTSLLNMTTKHPTEKLKDNVS